MHAHYLALRVDRARQLLRETGLSELEVAIATGFGSTSQFSRAFARAYGASPSRYRKASGRR
jgi:transcriptional regulator GlxA family with amidase domain